MTTFPDGRVERLAHDVVVIYSKLGSDYVRVCVPHRWASLDYGGRAHLPTCPHCHLAEDSDGLTRFVNINLRLMPVEAQP